MVLTNHTKFEQKYQTEWPGQRLRGSFQYLSNNNLKTPLVLVNVVGCRLQICDQISHIDNTFADIRYPMLLTHLYINKFHTS